MTKALLFCTAVFVLVAYLTVNNAVVAGRQSGLDHYLVGR